MILRAKLMDFARFARIFIRVSAMRVSDDTLYPNYNYKGSGDYKGLNNHTRGNYNYKGSGKESLHCVNIAAMR